MPLHTLDFTPVNRYDVPMEVFAASLTIEELRDLTHASVTTMLVLLDTATDVDVQFVPADPDARDPYATDRANHNLAWTIGHNIVHATASAEEYAAVAAELARGVEFHGRPRYEVPWQQVTTVEQCRHRLKESLRMRVASLDMWPDQPHLSLGYMPWKQAGFCNAKAIFTWGLAHDASHIQQIRSILQQANNM